MTDKEQINKCECTCDECGAESEPFWKKENKEQIIIDGVDVSECAIYRSSHTRTLCCSGIYCKEQQFYNCYFKQLARKTQECKQLKEDYAELEQECERLKSYGATLLADKNAMEIGRDDYMQRCKRLEQECEEIEKVINNILNSCLGRNTAGCRPAHNVCGDLIKILDIINKVKGE